MKYTMQVQIRIWPLESDSYRQVRAESARLTVDKTSTLELGSFREIADVIDRFVELADSIQRANAGSPQPATDSREEPQHKNIPIE